MTRAMAVAARRPTTAVVAGLRITVAGGVSNPAPAFGFSFAPLFEAALIDMKTDERVLDLGTGSGVWALLAVRCGADVTATELPHVPFDALRTSARANGLAVPRLLHGDLFEAVGTERFDRVLFNAPFHFGAPRTIAERAYVGGPRGEVLLRFLDALADHLTPTGRGFAILPRVERPGYEEGLRKFEVRALTSLWMPVLGHADVLELTPRGRDQGDA